MARQDDDFMQRYGSELSDTTRRAKWVSGMREHEDRPGQTLATRDHGVIMHWAEERGAQPATVESSWREGRPGVLRFDFPDYGGQSLQDIDWDSWFASFDERDLVFLFQEHLKNGSQSNFFTLDSPHRENA